MCSNCCYIALTGIFSQVVLVFRILNPATNPSFLGNPDLDPDPGFYRPKIKKFYNLKLNSVFLIYNGFQATVEGSRPPKRTLGTSKHVTVSLHYYFVHVFFASKSVQVRRPVESGSDPKHCFVLGETIGNPLKLSS
jgi:hypothetical protein